MSEYIDEVFDGLRSISTFSEDLDILSDAFDAVGNDKVSNDLQSISSGLRDAEERIRRAVARESSRAAVGNYYRLTTDEAEA